MNAGPAISVLMPAQNAQTTLSSALRSVLRSTDVDLELVVVDHGSVDRTTGILHETARRDPRVHVLSASRDVGLAQVLEFGRAHCRAPFIARMDADDVMHRHRLREDVALLRARPTVAVVASRVRAFPSGQVKPGLRAYLRWQNAALTSADIARSLWIEQPICHPATTFRAAALTAVGGFRVGPFPEDYDLFFRLVIDGFLIEKRPAVRHAWRIHADQATKRDPRYVRDAFAAVKARALVRHFRVDARPLFIAGTGREGRRLARALLAEGVAPTAFFDVAKDRIGRERRGAPVLDVAVLPQRFANSGGFVLGAVGTSGARSVVRQRFVDAGLYEERDFVMVA